MRLVAITVFSSILTLAQPRVTTLAGSLHPKAQPRYDRGPVASDFRMGYVTIVLKPSDAQQSALDDLLQQQQDPASPNYHRWLTPEQFGGRFGVDPTDLSAIAGWLKANGLQIEKVARARNWIAFSGSAEQVQGAFKTEVHRYVVNGEFHFANSTEISLPAVLDRRVTLVRGLNDFDLQPSSISPNYTIANGTHQLAPDDWATIYNVTPLYQMGVDGTGQRLAIIGRSDITQGDIDSFRSMFGLPPSTIEQHLIGFDPGVTNAAGEAALDLEWSGAIARNATIVYVYANNFNDAAQAVVDENLAPVMSQSFGICEPQAALGHRAMAQQANAEGITFVASSGDSGPAACDPHGIFGATNGTPATSGIAISLPASFPEVTAVGGTQFNEGDGQYWSATNTATGGSALSYIPEVVWNASGVEGLLASGGGGSIYFSKPAWQNAQGVPDDGVRDTPDISFNASGDHDGYTVMRGGVQRVTGGTSASAPSFAGVLALLNQHVTSIGLQGQPGLGNVNPGLYRLARASNTVFHDITQGNAIVPCVQGSPQCDDGSYGYSAAPGYDLATGLGSLDVFQFVTQWGAQAASSTTATTTVVTANPGSISFNDPVQVTATVTPNSGAAPLSGHITFSVSPTTILGTAPLVNVGGSMMATLTVPGGQLATGNTTVLATYDGDANFNGSTGSAAVNVASQSSGSSVVLTITPNPAHAGQAVRVTLSEKNGVGTTVTSWTINGNDDSSFLLQDFGTTTLPPYGTLFTGINTVGGPVFPVSRVYVFTGMDADGRTWSQRVVLILIAPFGSPQMTLSVAPSAVQQNAGADPSCQWFQQLLLQEQSGLAVQLTRFIAGGTDLTGQMQQLFGTTHLAALGSLQAPICWPAGTSLGSLAYEIDGTDQMGSPVSANFSATIAPPAAAPSTFSLSTDSVSMSAPPQTATASINLTLSREDAQWLVSVFPANQTTAWLSVNPTSGGMTQTVNLTASSAGLANGVYRAMLVFQAFDAIPQVIEVPVVFTVGPSSNMSIGGVTNGASYQPGFAPGMVLSVFGSQLAPSTMTAGSVPLPMTMAGVSATVNGVAAPLYYVSSTKLNLQIPYETGAGTAVLGVNNNGQVAAVTITVAPSAPGVFTDASQNLVPTATARPGDTLSLFLTGDGAVTPSLSTGASPFIATPIGFLPRPGLPLAVSVAGIPAEVVFEGVPPGLVGTTQVNFVVPAGVPDGRQQVVVSVAGLASEPAWLVVTP